jgi:hypothetical protein
MSRVFLSKMGEARKTNEFSNEPFKAKYISATAYQN